MEDKLMQANVLIQHCKETEDPYLDLGCCGISNLRDLPSLFECEHITTLILSNDWWEPNLLENQGSRNKGEFNTLSEIPDEILKLGKLQKLVAAGSFMDEAEWKITDASVLGGLVDLQTLILTSNKISNIDFIRNLKHLKNIDLDANRLIDISSLSDLYSLEYISVLSNNIVDISSLENLSLLRLLYLGSNEISDIECLSKLKRLERLFLGRNKISELGPLKSLTRLTALGLSTNEISNISSLSNLVNLETLSLEENNISDASHLEGLTELKILNLSGNDIADVDFLEGLQKLHSLNLSSNPIGNFGWLRALNQLFYLNLSNCGIKEISSVLLEANLEISLNEYSSSGICLYNNPIESPPVEIVSQGRTSVLEYYRLLKNEGSENIYEAKLTLVGEGGAGKTSLQIRLLDPSGKLPEAETHTRGVEISDWNISQTSDKKEIVHIWDFGGQDMYFPVHRFFLTENCVYVLMASSRNKAHNFEYWIPSIYQFGGTSPILIAQTCHKGYHEPWIADLKPFLEKPEFNIVSITKEKYFKLNLIESNNGLKEIQSAIIDQIRYLFQSGKPVPPSFIKLRNRLLTEKDLHPCMAYEDYARFCCEVDRVFENEATLTLFTGTMHRIGALLWYKDNIELTNWVILKPEWAMKAVYALIDDQLIEEHNGHVTIGDFERLWNDPVYKHRHLVLKKMLETFKIAFPKKHIKTDYILPARQLKVPSGSKWPLSKELLRLWVKFSFMPKGLINQVSADISDYIFNDGDVWNGGAIITDSLHQSQCLVLENIFDKKIDVVAKGKDARSLNLIVLQSIRNIVSDYRGVAFDLFVPCRCSICSITESPSTIYKYENLLKWSSKPNKILRCNESEEEYTVDDLLRSVGLQVLSKEVIERPVSEFHDSRPIVYNHVEIKPIQNNTNLSKIEGMNGDPIKAITGILEELRNAQIENKVWQDSLVEVLSGIRSVESAESEQERKEKWSGIKGIWETMKVFKDAKAIAEAGPWFMERMAEVTQLIDKISH